jgi:shikimate dehydrogenase
MQRGIALFGHNISYTLSPLIHNTAFRVSGLDYTYLPVDIAPPDIGKALEAAALLGFAGGNVTIPHKISVMSYLNSVSEIARRIGAVNTLSFTDAGIGGDNTDAEGFYRAYAGEMSELAGKDVLLLGTGGAARAVCDVLLTRIHPSSLCLSGRTRSHADRLEKDLRSIYGYGEILVCEWGSGELTEKAKHSTGIIQCTPIGSGKNAGMDPMNDSFRFTPGQIVIDLIYNPVETPFLKKALEDGARTRNGISMLLQQAALSFTIWTGTAFPMDEVKGVVIQHIKDRLTSPDFSGID